MSLKDVLEAKCAFVDKPTRNIPYRELEYVHIYTIPGRLMAYREPSAYRQQKIRLTAASREEGVWESVKILTKQQKMQGNVQK